jgi:hypothetical protein
MINYIIPFFMPRALPSNNELLDLETCEEGRSERVLLLISLQYENLVRCR